MSANLTEPTKKEGCFTCTKGHAAFFWRHGRMEVNCREFGMVAERDFCEKWEPIKFKEPA